MFKKILNSIDALLEKITVLFVNIAEIMTFSMIFVTSYGVVMRYFFRRPEPVTNELATILLLWGFLFAIPFVEHSERQIKADIFTKFMPRGMVKFLHGIISPILAIPYCAILTWKGWTLAFHSLRMGERSMSIWGEPLFPIKIVIPICYGFLTLICIRNLTRKIYFYSSEG